MSSVERGAVVKRSKVKRFADTFRAQLMTWADTSKANMTIGCSVATSEADGLAVLTFTLGDPATFSMSEDRRAVASALSRATEISAECDPRSGDLSVFDRRRILMFRRFHEPFTRAAAVATAKEVAAYIIMHKRKG